MAKNLLLALLVSTLSFASTSIVAAFEATPSKNPILKSDECVAPPPDNFHVTRIGSSDVDLAWTPAWAGATHTIAVFFQDESSAWTDWAIYYDIPGDSYTISGLTPGSYKISNATNCTTGERSVFDSEITFKVIELSTAGRIPINPSPVSDCSMVNYLTHNWVGFRVKEIATGRSNLFEFQMEGSVALVKRVFENQIVAVNSDGEFPIGPQHLGIGSSFQIDDKSNPNEEQSIGFVKITQYGGNLLPFIGICKDVNNPPIQWKSNYEFTAFTAESAIVATPSGGSGTGQGLIRPRFDSKFIAQSPFTNNLMVFVLNPLSEIDEATIYLLDSKGTVLLTQKLNMQSEEAFISTESILPGLYVLKIKSKQGVQTLKVLKPK